MRWITWKTSICRCCWCEFKSNFIYMTTNTITNRSNNTDDSSYRYSWIEYVAFIKWYGKSYYEVHTARRALSA